MEILSEVNREEGLTVLVSLHQVEIALRYCSQVVALKNGQVVYDGPSAELTEGLLKDIYHGHETESKNLAEIPPSSEEGGKGSVRKKKIGSRKMRDYAPPRAA
jgi:phosphonate transport system ATP-binding protein